MSRPVYHFVPEFLIQNLLLLKQHVNCTIHIPRLVDVMTLVFWSSLDFGRRPTFACPGNTQPIHSVYLIFKFLQFYARLNVCRFVLFSALLLFVCLLCHGKKLKTITTAEIVFTLPKDVIASRAGLRRGLMGLQPQALTQI